MNRVRRRSRANTDHQIPGGPRPYLRPLDIGTSCSSRLGTIETVLCESGRNPAAFDYGVYASIGSVEVMSWDPVQMIGSCHSPWAGIGAGASSRQESPTGS